MIQDNYNINNNSSRSHYLGSLPSCLHYMPYLPASHPLPFHSQPHITVLALPSPHSKVPLLSPHLNFPLSFPHFNPTSSPFPSPYLPSSSLTPTQLTGYIPTHTHTQTLKNKHIFKSNEAFLILLIHFISSNRQTLSRVKITLYIKLIIYL